MLLLAAAACSLLLCCLVISCLRVSRFLCLSSMGHARASPPRPASQRRGDSRPAGRARAVAGAHKAPLLAAAACRRGGCVVDCLERGQPPRSLAQGGGADAWRKVVGGPGGMVFYCPARRTRVLGLWISRFSVPARRPRQTRRHARRMGCAPLNCPCAKPR